MPGIILSEQKNPISPSFPFIPVGGREDFSYLPEYSDAHCVPMQITPSFISFSSFTGALEQKFRSCSIRQKSL